MVLVTFKSAMNMWFCYEHVTSGYDLVVMILASQANHAGPNPAVRMINIGVDEFDRKNNS